MHLKLALNSRYSCLSPLVLRLQMCMVIPNNSSSIPRNSLKVLKLQKKKPSDRRKLLSVIDSLGGVHVTLGRASFLLCTEINDKS